MLLLHSFERSAAGWFWATDALGHLTYLTDGIARIATGGAGQATGGEFAQLFRQADEELGLRRSLPLVMSRHSDFEKVSLRLANSDEDRWWAVSGNAQFDRTGRFAGYRGFGVDMTEQRRSTEHASRLAMYDPLTGLPNRLSMSRTLENALSGLDWHRDACALLLIDLDRFKQVNDTLGHQAGDGLLKQVAERLLAIIGDREQVYRLGGDEFQVILPRCDDRAALGDLALRIIDSLSQPYVVAGSRCVIGASVGVAIAPFDGRTSENLIRNADLALYAAKESGRGRYRLFSDSLLKAAEERRLLETDLRDALANGEISLQYQPVVATAEDRITAVEALIRWTHPERGPISPALFIPIAEEANLIEALGEWTLRKACDDAAQWPVKLRVAVNVSPIQFSNDALPVKVLSALSSSGLPPERLELELTEGVFLNESSATDQMFKMLKDIGVRLALDDFGTGYSSLGYLRTAPFDKIKIDQSFVRGATIPGSRNGAIMAAIVALADALGMETTAEGIETLDQLKLIRGLKVSHIQGYVYSPPLSCDDLVAKMKSGDLSITPSGPARQRSDRHRVYRKAAAYYDRTYCSILIRNLSESGALVEGLGSAGDGTRLLVDFGGGQLAVATVTRVSKQQHGIEFDQSLVNDGDGELCTRHRVGPSSLQEVGLPSLGHPEAPVTIEQDLEHTLDVIVERLGLGVREPVSYGAASSASGEQGGTGAPTVSQLADRYSEHVRGHARTRALHQGHLRDFILPRFGQARIDQVRPYDIQSWLGEMLSDGSCDKTTALQIGAIMSYMFTLAQRWGLPGAEDSLLAKPGTLTPHFAREQSLTPADVERLKQAAEASANPQLGAIVSLLMLTGVEPHHLLSATWDCIDEAKGEWTIPLSIAGATYRVKLSIVAMDLIRAFPRWDDCPYVIANPRTRKPYGSILGSWDSARKRAGLPDLSIHDLRYLSDIQARR